MGYEIKINSYTLYEGCEVVKNILINFDNGFDLTIHKGSVLNERKGHYKLQLTREIKDRIQDYHIIDLVRHKEIHAHHEKMYLTFIDESNGKFEDLVNNPRLKDIIDLIDRLDPTRSRLCINKEVFCDCPDHDIYYLKKELYKLKDKYRESKVLFDENLIDEGLEILSKYDAKVFKVFGTPKQALLNFLSGPFLFS